jgi:ribosome-binding factor A
MAQGYRPARIADQIRKELSVLLSRGVVHDPGIGFITLTRVTVTTDLQLARAFYTSLGDEAARKETVRALERATPYVRRMIGSRLGLRRVPELEFRFDRSVERQDRIEQILQDLHEHPPEALSPDPADPTDPPGDPTADERRRD